MLEQLSYLRELNVLSVVLRILLSMVLGGVLGIERGIKGRPAGFRTHMLVCLSSALVMMTNQYIAKLYGTGDPARMGAQVISGVGFLGAGTIIFTGQNRVKGITTAAGLWAAACVGLAIGIGFFEGAIIGSIAVFITVSALHFFDEYIHLHSYSLDLYVEVQGKEKLSEFLHFLKEHQFEVSDVHFIKNKMKNAILATLTIHSTIKRSRNEVERVLQSAEVIVEIM